MKRSIFQLKEVCFTVLVFVTVFSVYPQQVMKVAINHTGVKDRQAFSDDELKNNYSFRVFPNPANEILTVQLDQSPQNKNYNIYLLNIGKQEQAQNII